MTTTKYSSLMSLEAGFNILETLGYNHIAGNDDDSLVIDDKCCEGLSEVA